MVFTDGQTPPATGGGKNLIQVMSDTLCALASNLSLQNSITGLGIYDGSNIPLKDFLLDVKNGDASVVAEQKPGNLRAVLEKLRGPAEDCTYGKTFVTVNDPCTHLKPRFAPGRGHKSLSTITPVCIPCE